MRILKSFILMANIIILNISILLPQNKTIIYDLDNLNRLTRIDYGNGTVIQYTYDAVGNRKTHVITSQQTTYSISGKIGYFSDVNRAVPDVTISLSGSGNYSQKSNASGNYQFTGIPGGSYTSTPSKTNDLINGISGTDASRVARFAAGIITLNGHEMIAADVSCNGEISGVDASKIARYAAGLITEYDPGKPHWKFVPEAITNWASWPPIQFSSTRSYSPLQADQTNQNFIAIRAGDVTGDWTPDGGGLAKELMPITETKETIHLPDYSNILSLPLELNNHVKIEGVDIKVQFDPAYLEFANLVLRDKFIQDNNYEYVVNSEIVGNVTVVIFCKTNNLYDGSEKIGDLNFNVKAEEALSTPVTFTKFSVNENEQMTKIYVIESAIPTEYALYQNYPNPFNNTTTICYDLPDRGHVLLAIYNIEGQIVTILKDETENPGRKQLKWNNPGLASGVYFYQLSVKTDSKTKSFLKTNKLLLLK